MVVPVEVGARVVRGEGNVMSLIYQVPLCAGVHEHACPICYERKLCVMSCSREDDQIGDGGAQAGSIAVCDDCAQKYLSRGVEP